MLILLKVYFGTFIEVVLDYNTTCIPDAADEIIFSLLMILF